MRDNKEEQTAVMVKHWEHMDTLNALIAKITEAFHQTQALATEVSSVASNVTTAVHQLQRLANKVADLCNAVVNIAPLSPHAQPSHSTNESFTLDAQPPSGNDVPPNAQPPTGNNMPPNVSAVPPGPSAPHPFGNVRLGPSLHASLYPSGNHPRVPLNRPPDFAHKSYDPPRWPPPVDTSNSDSVVPPCQGGPIASPQPRDKERQARQLHTSLFDTAGLASPEYHGEMAGVNELSLRFIHACGYNSFSIKSSDNILLCYRNIQQDHKKVLQGWFNPCSRSYGPSIKWILERGLTIFPRLDSLTAADTVTFYNKL
jgi:hypothetical protein